MFAKTASKRNDLQFFQDKLVLFDWNLASLLGLLLYTAFGVLESLALQVIALVRSDSPQLRDTRQLFAHVFGQMVAGKPLKLSDAQQVLSNFEYPESFPGLNTTGLVA